jgi:signal transduction histidine kinase
MLPARPFLLRPERLIAGGRVVLACLALFAVWLDPTEPTTFPILTYGLRIGYVVYAWIVAVYAWKVETLPRRWPQATMAFDIALFSVFIFFTPGPRHPFHVYFVFALMCATIRWQARGTLVVASIVLGVFAAFGVYVSFFAAGDGFDDRAFLIRGTYLLVIAVLLGYVGVHERGLLREMWMMTSWPNPTNEDAPGLSRHLLRHAQTLFETEHVALTWSYIEEDRTHLGSFERSEWRYYDVADHVARVHEDLAESSFILSDLGSRQVLVRHGTDQLSPWAGTALRPEFVALIGRPTRVLSATAAGARVIVRLFLFDKPKMSSDDLVLANLVASLIATRLDAIYLHSEMTRNAAIEERVRLSRDLHDGVLQSFTGVGLRLAAIQSRLGPSAADVAADVEDLQRIIAEEQKELRFFIQDLRPQETASPRGQLHDRLADLASRVEREWDIRVVLKVAVSIELSEAFCREIYHVVREALVNAARHGLARTATVTVASDADVGVSVSVEDDGRGFSFTGVYSTDDLAHNDLGPKTLRERVQALNGSLTLASSPTGASLHIVLPRVA